MDKNEVKRSRLEFVYQGLREWYDYGTTNDDQRARVARRMERVKRKLDQISQARQPEREARST